VSLQIDTVKEIENEKERIRSQMRHQWPWLTCKQEYNRPTVYIRLLNVFARVFLVASRLSIVCLSVCVQHKSKSSERIMKKFSEGQQW